VGTQLAALCATSGCRTARPGTVSCRWRVRGHICPDERDSQPGRERPNQGWPSGEVGGSRNRVAHAPAASNWVPTGCSRLLARQKTPRGVTAATAFLSTTYCVEAAALPSTW